VSRREVDGTYILEMHKPEKRGELKSDFVMDFCTEVVKVGSRLTKYQTFLKTIMILESKAGSSRV
jgi:hypothetical protein